MLTGLWLSINVQAGARVIECTPCVNRCLPVLAVGNLHMLEHVLHILQMQLGSFAGEKAQYGEKVAQSLVAMAKAPCLSLKQKHPCECYKWPSCRLTASSQSSSPPSSSPPSSPPDSAAFLAAISLKSFCNAFAMSVVSAGISF